MYKGWLGYIPIDQLLDGALFFLFLSYFVTLFTFLLWTRLYFFFPSPFSFVFFFFFFFFFLEMLLRRYLVFFVEF